MHPNPSVSSEKLEIWFSAKRLVRETRHRAPSFVTPHSLRLCTLFLRLEVVGRGGGAVGRGGRSSVEVVRSRSVLSSSVLKQNEVLVRVRRRPRLVHVVRPFTVYNDW